MLDFTSNSNRILVTAPRFITEITQKEIESLGYACKKEKDNALSLRGSLEDAMKLNLWLRTAHKVLFHLFSGQAENIDEFYDVVKDFEWETIIPSEGYFSIQSAVHNDTIRDTRLPNLKAKDAIVDRLTEINGLRPNSGPDTEQTVLFVYWNKSSVSVYVDTAGTPLNRRGYRHQPHKAPLQETLAAALILQSEWDPTSHFVNPMCGSGTLAIEAFLIGTKTAPGLLRTNFGFMHILPYQADVWNKLVEEAKKVQIPTTEGMIVASDKDPEAIAAAKGNAERAGAAAHILFRVTDFRDSLIPVGKGTVMMNPEYGERLGEKAALEKVYGAIGSFFKRHCNGYSCYVVSSSKELLEKIRMTPSSTKNFLNAKMDVQLIGYEVFDRNELAVTSESSPKRKLRSRKKPD
ncbi:class I SAM-dependent RNA methyltransferase [bacterium]|nr:MAG: class I SAM-dependent RNA methyltransferase [bacterium]